MGGGGAVPCRRYVLYMAWSPDKYRMGISAIPRVDFSYLQNTEGYQGMAFISPPLPWPCASTCWPYSPTSRSAAENLIAT